MNKRVLVNIGIVLVLALIGYVCYVTGKAYNVIVENVELTKDGKTFPPLEAVQIGLDQTPGEPIYLLDGDRLVGTAVGSDHILTIEVLDENDKPIETVTTTFKIKELKGSPRILNVPYFYAKAKEKAVEKKK